MATLLFILMIGVICAVFVLLLTALSIGIGYLIALVIPSLTITDTITAGAVIMSFMVYFLVKFLAIVNNFLTKTQDDDDDDDDDDDEKFPKTRDAGNKGPALITPSSFIPKSRGSRSRRQRKPSDNSGR